MTVTNILQRLDDGVRRCGRGWLARCPAHEDRSASLSIAKGADGRVLLHCFAGCNVHEVVTAMGLKISDLFASSSPRSGPARRPQTVLDVAIELARRQSWARPGVLEKYATADFVREQCRLADRLRRKATLAGDCDFSWELAEIAAAAEREALAHEAAVDGGPR